MKLINILKAKDDSNFKEVIKNEIQNVDRNLLPLQQGLSLSSYVGQSAISAVILNVTENADYIKIKSGIFYTGIIAGCNCADDPSPSDEQTEYCELLFNININTAEATVTLLDG